MADFEPLLPHQLSRLSDQALVDVAGGESREPDAVLETDRATLRALLWEGLTPAQAEQSGAARIEGDRRVLKRFLGLFPRPEPVPPAPGRVDST